MAGIWSAAWGLAVFDHLQHLVVGLRQVDREHAEPGELRRERRKCIDPERGLIDQGQQAAAGRGATTRTTDPEGVVLKTPLELDPLQAVEAEPAASGGIGGSTARSKKPTATGWKPSPPLASAERSG